MIHKFTIRPRQAGSAHEVGLRRRLGLPDIAVWKDYYVETRDRLDGDQVRLLCRELGDPMLKDVVHGATLPAEGAVQVAHRNGIVDNESESIVTLCAVVGIHACAGKVAHTYVSSDPRLRELIERWCFNANIEELHEREPAYETLRPVGTHLPPERYDLRPMNDAELGALGRANGRHLDLRQMRQIQAQQVASGQGDVTDVLLEALDARWSDHCSHTTWRSHGDLLARLAGASAATENPNIVSMFRDNAGVWAFYGGWALALKAETHNGPTALSAYFGQLTKLGGVIRDILGTGEGADPIGCFELTVTGIPGEAAPLPGRPGPRQIALDTVRAIREYGNTFGVPMMWSHMTFHPSYRAKPFALGGCVGLVPAAQGVRGRPVSGDMAVLIGGTAVQIGAPLEEVKFRKAIVELREAGCLQALTDLGAAGLNSAVGEMGEACGVWINTALVPLKTAGLPMWRILLSESQERMLLVVPPAAMDAARRIFTRHQVRATVIGRFVDSGRYRVVHDPALDEAAVERLQAGQVPPAGGEVGFDVDYRLLAYEPDPVAVTRPAELQAVPVGWPRLTPEDLPSLAARMVRDPELASQAWADGQYDSTIQGNTVRGPQYGRRHRVASGYWAGTPVADLPAAAVLSTAFDPWLFEVHPVRALRQLFCRAIGIQVLAGVSLSDVCLCDNFYTPDRAPDGSGWLVALVDELARLVRFFGTPVISGKDSSAGSVETPEGVISVPPAVFLTALGKVPDAGGLVPEGWTRPGNVLVRVGPTCWSPAATVAGRAVGLASGPIDDLAVDEHRAYMDTLAAGRRLWHSATPIGAGGVLGRLIVGSLATDLGVDALCPAEGAPGLLAEHRCGALLEVDEADVKALPSALDPVVVGRLSATPGVRVGGREILTPQVLDGWSSSFEERLR